MTIEGSIRVKFSRLKRRVAAGAPVLLVPAGVDLGGEMDSETSERLAALEAEAARLQGEVVHAMQHISNFTEATRVRDRLMAERDGVLAERQDVLAAVHGRHEHVARAAAVAQGIADSKGWFRISPVPPGQYTLYARMTREDTDLEWIEPLTVGAGPVQIDLDEKRAHGLLPRPEE